MITIKFMPHSYHLYFSNVVYFQPTSAVFLQAILKSSEVKIDVRKNVQHINAIKQYIYTAHKRNDMTQNSHESSQTLNIRHQFYPAYTIEPYYYSAGPPYMFVDALLSTISYILQ